MKVSELVKELLEYPQDLEVWRAKDDEGNGFDPVLYTNDYVMNDDRDIGLRELTPELEDAGYSEDDVISGVDVIIIW